MKFFLKRDGNTFTAEAPSDAVYMEIGAWYSAGHALMPIVMIDWGAKVFQREGGEHEPIPDKHFTKDDIAWTLCTCGVDDPPEPSVSVDRKDVEYDGVSLRDLLICDEIQRRGECSPHWRPTQVQRAAVSAHWSAQLRAKVAAAKKVDQNQVTYCEEDEL